MYMYDQVLVDVTLQAPTVCASLHLTMCFCNGSRCVGLLPQSSPDSAARPTPPQILPLHPETPRRGRNAN